MAILVEVEPGLIARMRYAFSMSYSSPATSRPTAMERSFARSELARDVKMIGFLAPMITPALSALAKYSIDLLRMLPA